MAVAPNVWRMRHGVICNGRAIPYRGSFGSWSERGACGLARTCSLTTPRPRSPRRRFFWIGELEVSAANLQGGGGRAVRLLSGLWVPFRLLLLCVVHATEYPMSSRHRQRTFWLCQLACQQCHVGPIWDCLGATWGMPSAQTASSTGKAKARLRLESARAVTGAATPCRSGQVRFITRPKSRTMRATRQLMLPPSTVS